MAHDPSATFWTDLLLWLVRLVLVVLAAIAVVGGTAVALAVVAVATPLVAIGVMWRRLRGMQTGALRDAARDLPPAGVRSHTSEKPPN